jgi:hypothetical protein
MHIPPNQPQPGGKRRTHLLLKYLASVTNGMISTTNVNHSTSRATELRPRSVPSSLCTFVAGVWPAALDMTDTADVMEVGEAGADDAPPDASYRPARAMSWYSAPRAKRATQRYRRSE